MGSPIIFKHNTLRGGRFYGITQLDGVYKMFDTSKNWRTNPIDKKKTDDPPHMSRPRMAVQGALIGTTLTDLWWPPSPRMNNTQSVRFVGRRVKSVGDGGVRGGGQGCAAGGVSLCIIQDCIGPLCIMYYTYYYCICIIFVFCIVSPWWRWWNMDPKATENILNVFALQNVVFVNLTRASQFLVRLKTYLYNAVSLTAMA